MDRLYLIHTLLEHAETLLREEITETTGDRYTLCDALAMTEDAHSQVRGEWNGRQPEFPLYVKGAA